MRVIKRERDLDLGIRHSLRGQLAGNGCIRPPSCPPPQAPPCRWGLLQPPLQPLPQPPLQPGHWVAWEVMRQVPLPLASLLALLLHPHLLLRPSLQPLLLPHPSRPPHLPKRESEGRGGGQERMILEMLMAWPDKRQQERRDQVHGTDAVKKVAT